MNARLQEIFKQLTKSLGTMTASQIGKFIEEVDDLRGQCETHDEYFLACQLDKVLDSLETAKLTIDRLHKPIIKTGRLEKNHLDRYELDDHELTCGALIEVLLDEEDEGGRWVESRIEHNGDDYYLVADKKAELEGLKARIRAR